MRKLALPVPTVGPIIAACAGSIENKDLAARLIAAQPHLSRLEGQYALYATNNILYTLPVETITHGVSQEEMSWLYSKSFSRKNGPTRKIYDSLKMLALDGICPLCNQRVVRTLDHHLSKKDYPAFAVTPVNMIPSCRDCNSDTLARRLKVSDDQTFHPYFDNVDDGVWLFGHVEQVSPPVIRFEARPPVAWEQGKKVKVEQHFRIFKLGALYSTHAASELQNLYGDIDMISRRGSALAIKEELAQRAIARRRVIRNTWQAAMYDALSESDWFCQGGFREIIA